MQETQVWSLGQKDSLEKWMATHFSNLAWRTPWTEECGWLWSMGSQRVWNTTEKPTHLLFILFCFFCVELFLLFKKLKYRSMTGKPDNRANFKTMLSWKKNFSHKSTISSLTWVSILTPRHSSTQLPAGFHARHLMPNSETGPQLCPSADRMPKIVLRSQIPQNTPSDMALSVRGKILSPTHQKRGTSPNHQETYTSLWTYSLTRDQATKARGTMTLQPAERRP